MRGRLWTLAYCQRNGTYILCEVDAQTGELLHSTCLEKSRMIYLRNAGVTLLVVMALTLIGLIALDWFMTMVEVL